jgi:hypothetical protein
MSSRWRYFGTREPGLARAWAASGGVAVHENLFRHRGRRSAHLLAADEASLVAAARAVGCAAEWLQRTRTLHFDLVGIHLEAALRRCGRDPTWPPARTVWRE